MNSAAHRHHHHGPSDEVAGLDEVEVAVAFVDLAGYSVLTEMCGDREAAELAIRLAEQAREALHPGVRLIKTIGDAVMLAAGTADAILATITALAEAASDEGGFLALRAGVHHGTAIIGRDGDLFGHNVNVAARITALAGAGQAVITVPVLPAATRASLPVTSIGPRSLRNISTSVELHAFSLASARRPYDPVCGIGVDPRAAAAHRVRNGRDWWFCSDGCADRFDL